MDFTLTRPQKEIQKAAREFAKGEFDKETGLDYEKNGIYPKEILKKACELGFVGIHFPEQYLGSGLGLFENCLVAEELCSKDSSFGLALTLSGYGSECILRFGTEAQKKRYLPEIADGELFSAAAFLEPGQGFDFRKLKTKALKTNGGWTINGEKTLVANAGLADVYVVLCQTGDDSLPPEKRHSMFVVDAATKGLSFREAGRRLGCNMLPAADLVFENLRAGEENLIGEEGKGLEYALAYFRELRVLLAAQAVGIGEGAFKKALGYAREREQFGKKIASFGAISHKLADMATKIESARTLVYRAAWSFDNGILDSGLASMAKMVATRAAVDVCYEAIQIHGGYGFMTEYEVEHFYRDAKFLDLFCGSLPSLKDEIAAGVIGRTR
ncbi:MAG: acyl-CoA dehydrogenase [Desulfococcus sp. 4484_241]|nr:MAG: acyl-CoA dehydrogenase [Desulfococcus sp. 4484_241]